ncbi:hypothetical protein GH733_016819 [Mirounga leonina]|nr:hypothetical protein GH733_016819 [Mirounga leonina]
MKILMEHDCSFTTVAEQEILYDIMEVCYVLEQELGPQLHPPAPRRIVMNYSQALNNCFSPQQEAKKRSDSGFEGPGEEL